MSSAYAPLPFSYLSADGPKPRAGLRKDGVYGTSADVPRIYEEPEPVFQRDDRAGPGFLNNPYGVYANAPNNSVQQVKLDSYEPVYRPSQMPQPMGSTARTQESPYDIRQQRPDILENRSQKPGGEYQVYSIPEADYVTSDKDLRQREDRKPGYGNHQPEPSTSRQERVQSYFPPRDAGRQTPDIDKQSRGQNEVTAPGTNDNFILVKDPNRTDQKPASDASALSRDAGKTKLQTLFEDSGPTPTPRTQNYTSNTANPSHEIGFEEPNRSPSYGLNTAERPPVTGKGTRGVTPNENRDQTAYSEKRGKGTQCCRCSTCSAVVIAIIITAVICLGVGFVAGWFGAIANREKNDMSPTSQSTAAFNEQPTNATTPASSLATTKESTSTTKTSTTSHAHLSSTATTTTTHSSTSSETMKSSSATSNATSNATTKSASAPTG